MIELGVAAEDAGLVERLAARGGEVGGDPRAAGDAVAQCQESTGAGAGAGEGAGEGVFEAEEGLKEGEVGVGAMRAEQPGAAAALEDAGEVAEELRQALGAEGGGALLGGGRAALRR